jgi:pimeloyl-ACP methyl ester carboxylesterase
VNGRLNEEVGYSETLQAARRASNQEAVKELEQLAPYPGDGPPEIQKVVTERHWDEALGGVRYGRADAPEGPVRTLSPDYSDADSKATDQGEIASSLALFPEMAAIDFRPVVKFRCPVFFFAGVDDRTTPRTLVESYFATLHAPQKRLFVIDHAAHYLVGEAPGIVLMDLVNVVRPLSP